MGSVVLRRAAAVVCSGKKARPKLPLNPDGSKRLLVFCLRSFRCEKQCRECLLTRSRWRLEGSGSAAAIPKVIYLNSSG